MSDCSTQAMKPKEPPRTNPFPNGLWPNRGDCHTCAKTGHCEYEQFGERIATARCEYRPSAYHSLEQRYKQLEQVAMWAYEIMRDFCAPAYANEYRDKLEALGVSVDD